MKVRNNLVLHFVSFMLIYLNMNYVNFIKLNVVYIGVFSFFLQML